MRNKSNLQTQEQERTRYFLYARKSTDTEDKQVQSIDAQKRELLQLAQEQNLNVVKIFEESRSAKAPGRPIFTDVINRIAKGEADGLLVWKLNRLARNPVDGGTISWMLQQGVIRHVQTYGRSYYPDDNVLVMAVELGMANQYVKDLSVDTKRGVRQRVERGYPNGVAPIGYWNDLTAEPGNRGWIVDEKSFPIIKQLLELFLTGVYSIRKLANEANEKMGLRTPVRKKQGGKKLVLSYVCDTILKNPVYAGFFITNDGVRHELHQEVPRMITEEQYWEIQKILGSRGRSRLYKNLLSFAYVGPTKCGACGGSVTAENKYQLICSECKNKFSYQSKTECSRCHIKIEEMEEPKYLHYIYYHCTKRVHPDCPEKCLREDNFDNQLASYFGRNLQMSEALRDWCMDNLETLQDVDKQSVYEKKAVLEKTLFQKENELKELALMKARGQLDDSEFISVKGGTKMGIESVKREIRSLGNVDPQKLIEEKKAFDMASRVENIFRKGDTETKKSAIFEIGSNLTLKEKKLNVSNVKIYAIIEKGLLAARVENPAFEPEFCQANKDKTDTFVSVCPTLLRG